MIDRSCHSRPCRCCRCPGAAGRLSISFPQRRGLVVVVCQRVEVTTEMVACRWETRQSQSKVMNGGG